MYYDVGMRAMKSYSADKRNDGMSREMKRLCLVAVRDIEEKVGGFAG